MLAHLPTGIVSAIAATGFAEAQYLTATGHIPPHPMGQTRVACALLECMPRPGMQEMQRTLRGEPEPKPYSMLFSLRSCA